MSGPLASDGYVVDFSVIKKEIRALCKEWDEATLIPTQCPHVHVSRISLPAISGAAAVSGDQGASFPAPTSPQPPSIVLHVNDGSVFVMPESDVKLLPLSNVSVEELAVLLVSLTKLSALTSSTEPPTCAEFTVG